ncbi:MAG: calcium-binding protein [Fuscovulum sp.]|nr:calcium-binding protein [Fuscovulum sp.]
MPTTIVTVSPAVDTTYLLANSNDDLMIGPNVVIAGSGGVLGAVVTAANANNTVTVAGTILTPDIGVQVGTDPAFCYSDTLNVTASGQIISQTDAVYAFCDTAIVQNSGLISGVQSGIVVRGTEVSLITITNAGRIEAMLSAAIMSSGSYGPAALEIINSGVISSPSNAAIYSVGETRLSNTGTLEGDVVTGAWVDTVTNRGTIIGDVTLAQAKEVLDNRGGTVDGVVDMGLDSDVLDNRGGTIFGTIFLGGGADKFLASAIAGDTVDGGDGLDEVDFRSGPAIQLALDGSFESGGGALGDVYVGVERVLGSGQGDDIRGDALANQLLGQAGADRLDGADGADMIRGGLGIDTLTGGLGNDNFRFLSLAEAGDVITDFSNVVGNNDNMKILASAFGGGLVAGALAATQFQSRADNLAQDADDRFIFRTTDRTLWFDADGNGAGAAVLVADLQAGAVMRATDILLF